MSIPLVQEATKDAINTSIIAIKRNIERINMLLGLSNSEEIDTSKFATKEELQQAVTDLQPVDEVAIDNMHSVTSNAVAEVIGGTKIKTYTFGFPLYSTQANTGYGWVNITLPDEITNNNIIGVYVQTGSISDSKGSIVNLIFADGTNSYMMYTSPYGILGSQINYFVRITYIV